PDRGDVAGVYEELLDIRNKVLELAAELILQGGVDIGRHKVLDERRNTLHERRDLLDDDRNDGPENERQQRDEGEQHDDDAPASTEAASLEEPRCGVEAESCEQRQGDVDDDRRQVRQCETEHERSE